MEFSLAIQIKLQGRKKQRRNDMEQIIYIVLVQFFAYFTYFEIKEDYDITLLSVYSPVSFHLSEYPP
jgi:hypothetical protein